ncbi:hypothetical protein AB0I49_25575 [Streptomyces sp. NPDC050617]|uniref:hypothetical protein n=1 Tax=Streptomyces sp. NPDC050617 TaxID=3154628 RepID=UPI003431539D
MRSAGVRMRPPGSAARAGTEAAHGRVRLGEAGRALGRHGEVPFAASTTGPTNLYAAVACFDNRALHRYLTGPVAALPGLTQVESAPVTRTLKRAGLIVGA